MKARPPKRPPPSPALSGKKPPRKKPMVTVKQDTLFESLRQELGL
ncbi:hypothetical protein [Luteolibacter sp. Populi]